MKNLTRVVLVLAMIVSSSGGELPQPTVDSTPRDLMSNDDVPIPAVHFNIRFPFFRSSDVKISSNIKMDDNLKEANSSTNSTQEGDKFAVSLKKVFSFSPSDNTPYMSDKMVSSRLSVLTFKNRNLTGEELATELISRQRLGQPVTYLILSNCRVDGLSVKSFEPVQDTLRKLRMVGINTNGLDLLLDALSELSNLQHLVLARNGLTRFRRYPKLRDTLEVLDLSSNMLDEISPELSVLTSLRELDLSYNWNMMKAESWGLYLPNLEVLSLADNILVKAIIEEVNFPKLRRVRLDGNSLTSFEKDVHLPTQLDSVTLSTNDWHCECSLLKVTDNNYKVLDIDRVHCLHCFYPPCDYDYYIQRKYYPVANLTKDSMKHLGCSGNVERYYLFRQGLRRLSELDPESLAKLAVFMLACVLMFVGTCLLCRNSNKKKFNRQTWLKIQQKSYLQIGEEKPSEVPYIKIDSSQNMQA